MPMPTTVTQTSSHHARSPGRSCPCWMAAAMAANATSAVPSLNRLSFSTIVRRRAGRLHLAEGRDHRDGVGGGQDRAEQQGEGPRQAQAEVEDRPRHGHGDEHSRDGQQHDRPHVRAQPAQVGGDRGLEQQDGQEDLDDDLGIERDRAAPGPRPWPPPPPPARCCSGRPAGAPRTPPRPRPAAARRARSVRHARGGLHVSTIIQAPLQAVRARANALID